MGGVAQGIARQTAAFSEKWQEALAIIGLVSAIVAIRSKLFP